MSSAALAGCLRDEVVADYLIPATLSTEPGHRSVLDKIGASDPLLDWSLGLGEGTGASLAVPLLRSACAVVREMATLDEVVESESTSDTNSGGETP